MQPSLGFVIIFLLFSLLFLSNSYKLWFKTDEYYQSIYNSLTREPSVYPFRDFFLKRWRTSKVGSSGRRYSACSGSCGSPRGGCFGGHGIFSVKK
jgi:hypothetical protein